MVAIFKKHNITTDLEAVKQDGYALQYVREQTPEICLEAVKKNGDALQYVKEQTPEICIEAVKQNINAIRYITDTKTFISICKELILSIGLKSK